MKEIEIYDKCVLISKDFNIINVNDLKLILNGNQDIKGEFNIDCSNENRTNGTFTLIHKKRTHVGSYIDFLDVEVEVDFKTKKFTIVGDQDIVFLHLIGGESYKLDFKEELINE